MSEVTHRIDVTNSPRGASMAAAENNKMNDQWFDPNIFRPTVREIHVYTISQREFRLSIPPHFQRLHIPACPKDQKYRHVLALPDPFQQTDRDGNGRLRGEWTDARRVAMDIVNPNNLTLDQDTQLNERFVYSEGENRSQQGLFWSLNNPPSEEEVKAAYARRHKYYDSLIKKARVVELANPRGLLDLINTDYHMAADYFKLTNSWHTTLIEQKSKEQCPNCDEEITSGVAFHKDSDGDICVIDWKRTVEAGKKKRSDVPEGLEWWDTSTPEEKSLAALVAKK